MAWEGTDTLSYGIKISLPFNYLHQQLTTTIKVAEDLSLMGYRMEGHLLQLARLKRRGVTDS